MRTKRLAGLGAGVVAALAVGALAPSAAQAHPCAETWSLSTATFLSANNSAAAWAGSLPTMNNDSDCAPVEDAYTGPASIATTGADASADPIGPLADVFEKTPNMTIRRLLAAHSAARHGDQPRRHQLRHRVQGQPRLPGPLERLPRPQHLRPDESGPALQHRGVPPHFGPGRRGRARQHPRAHLGLVEHDRRERERDVHGRSGRHRVRGHPHLEHRRSRRPRSTSASCGCRRTGNDAGAPAVGCGAHTATGVPDDARGHLYLYVGGSSGTCTGMDVVRISCPTRATPSSCAGPTPAASAMTTT